jgi:hypothetical protein
MGFVKKITNSGWSESPFQAFAGISASKLNMSGE